jgi:hypothetical protein
LPDGQPNPKYSPLRAFWLEPTIHRLFEAGEHFRKVMLPAKQLLAEDCFEHPDSDCPPSSGLLDASKAPELKRFKIPEFEAMKKLMVDGMVAPRSQFTPLMTWQELGIKVKNEEDTKLHLFSSAVSYTMYENIKLPAAQPSFFKAVDEIGLDRAVAEQLSAQYGISHRMTVLSKPKYEISDGTTLMGAWDIGMVRDSLTQPVYEVGVGKNGQVSVAATDVQTDSMRNDFSGIQLGAAKDFLPGYKKIKQPWIFFRLPQPPILSKANVKKLKKIFFNKADTSENLVTTTIDLDNDGVADLLVSEAEVNGGCDRLVKVVLANVAGQWYLLTDDNIDSNDCGYD